MGRSKISEGGRRKVFEKYNYQCNDCSAPGTLEIHHIKPVIKGGSNKVNNLILVCMVCHVLRHGGKPKRLIENPYWVSARKKKDRLVWGIR